MFHRLVQDRKRNVLLALVFLSGWLTACGATTEQTAAIAVGRPAPPFTLPAADGSEVSLADYAGKQPVLLYFHMAAG